MSQALPTLPNVASRNDRKYAYVADEGDSAGFIGAGVDWVWSWTLENGGTPLLIAPSIRLLEHPLTMASGPPRIRWETPETFRRGEYWGGGAVLAVWLGRTD